MTSFKKVSIALLLLAFLLLPTFSYAADGGGGNTLPPSDHSGGSTGNPSGNGDGGSIDTQLVNPLNGVDSLPAFLDLILKAVVQLGSVVLVLMLVYTGFLFVTAQGAEEKLSNARNALLWTVIGGLILLGASAISAVIQDTVSNLS